MNILIFLFFYFKYFLFFFFFYIYMHIFSNNLIIIVIWNCVKKFSTRAFQLFRQPFAFLSTFLNSVFAPFFLFPLTFLPAQKPIIDHFTTLLPIVVFLLFVNLWTAYYRYYCRHFIYNYYDKKESSFEKKFPIFPSPSPIEILGRTKENRIRCFKNWLVRYDRIFLKADSILHKFLYFTNAVTVTRSFDLLSTWIFTGASLLLLSLMIRNYLPSFQ